MDAATGHVSPAVRHSGSRFRRFLIRGVPATTWVIVLYAILVFGYDLIFAEQTVPLAPRDSFVELYLFSIPTLSDTPLLVTGGWLLVVLALAALAIESVRATRLRDNTGNDYMSVITLIVALILLIAVPQFSNMVFAVIFIACLIDVLQDRVIGQAVARRDWGVHMAPPDA
jgi:hypothetical protein